MNAQILRRTTLAVLTGALLACGGDATAPEANLSQEQVDDMMEALSTTGSFSGGPATGASIASLAVVTVAETVDCPNGGTASFSGTTNVNEQTGNATVSMTQNFNACKATSSSERLWTFNGSPNIQTNMTLTVNQSNDTFTMTGTQTGGIAFSSDVGSGRCSIDLSLSLGTTVEGGVNVNINGTVCGRTVQYSYEETLGAGN